MVKEGISMEYVIGMSSKYGNLQLWEEHYIALCKRQVQIKQALGMSDLDLRRINKITDSESDAKKENLIKRYLAIEKVIQRGVRFYF